MQRVAFVFGSLPLEPMEPLEKRQQVAGVHCDECRISRDAEMCRIYHWEIFVACESARSRQTIYDELVFGAP